MAGILALGGDSPEGAGYDFQAIDALPNNGDSAGGIGRGGGSVQFIRTTSNLGFGTNTFHNVNFFNGITARCMNALGATLVWCPSLILDSQALITGDRNSVGVYRFETMISWAANANFECGVAFYPSDGTGAMPALMTGAGTQPGILIDQNNGAPRIFTRRDAATTESVPVVWPGGTAGVGKWSALKVEIRSAGKSNPGRLRVFVDNLQVLERLWTGAHALPLFNTALALSKIQTAFIVRGNPAAPVYAMAVAQSKQIMATA